MNGGRRDTRVETSALRVVGGQSYFITFKGYQSGRRERRTERTLSSITVCQITTRSNFSPYVTLRRSFLFRVLPVRNGSTTLALLGHATAAARLPF